MRSRPVTPTSTKPSSRKRHLPFLLLLCLLLAALLPLFAQERLKLEEKREKLLREIQVTTELLNKTKKSKAATLDRYKALQTQIRRRQQLIQTLQTEMLFTDQSIEQTAIVAEALEEDVSRLKKEYAEIARSAYRHRMNNSNLLFLFSAQNINSALQRWRYLQQYDTYRKKQARLILETQAMLTDKLRWLEERRLEKEELLAKAQEQSSLLEKELTDKDQLLRTLKSEEGRLNSDLKKQQDEQRKLNAAIEAIIREELAKSNESAASGNSVAAEERIADGASFESYRGKLNWPVNSGVISSYFGRQEHPTLAGVYITNNGIDIQTDKNAEVRSVFGGEVVGTQFIPGFDYMVIVRHGNYYTVYSNLSQINVKRNDKVGARQKIGTVRTDNTTNTSELHFEVWKEKTRLDPVKWVKKN